MRDVARKPMDPAEAAYGDGVVVEKRERKRARAFGHVGDFYGKRADGMPVQLVRFGACLPKRSGSSPLSSPTNMRMVDLLSRGTNGWHRGIEEGRAEALP